MTDQMTSANSSEQHQLRARVLDILASEGFRPGVDGDGDVAVMVQGQQMFVRCLEGEVTVMRVFGQWKLGDVQSDELTLLRVSNLVCAQLSVVKTTIGEGVLVASAEHIITESGGTSVNGNGTGNGGAGLSLLLLSSLELVLAAVSVWNQTLTEATGRSGG